jgi:hypothetical protein
MFLIGKKHFEKATSYGFIIFQEIRYFLLVFVTVVFINNKTNSQERNSIAITNRESNTEMIFSKNHISFTVTPYLAERAEISKRNTNRYAVHSSSQPGIEAGIAII